MKNIKPQPYTLYPVLFAFYPVLALLILNIDQTTRLSLARLTLFSVLFSLVVWLVVSIILKNPWKAGLLTFVIQVLFFSYGHEQRIILGIPNLNPFLGGNIFLGWSNLALLVLLAFLIIRTKSSLLGISKFLTYTNIILVAMPLLQIGYHDLTVQKPVPVSAAQVSGLKIQGGTPDIYFIIMDSYSRQDLLKADFGFDNQPFVNQLTGLGFQVMSCSRSNYNATDLSLSSMLNMSFEDELGVAASDVSSGKNPMIPTIRDNLVRHYLEQLGYSFYTFENEYPGLDWPGTSKFLMPKQESWFSQQLLPTENLFIKDTAVKILLDAQVGIFKQLQTTVNSPYAAHIKLTQFTLKALPGTADLPGPKFVYAHLLLPHKPFVFDAQGNIRSDARFYSQNGNPINDDFYRQGYTATTEYVNSQIVPVLKSVLDHSKKPPIIILMGDHGYAAKDTRFENLVAVYLPGNYPSPFYQSISNINIFRNIFNEYFGGKFTMLPDISYRIDFKRGVYLKVPEAQPGCIPPKK